MTTSYDRFYLLPLGSKRHPPKSASDLLARECATEVAVGMSCGTHCLFLNTGEPLVKQDSKQIQVDLQDLGYETCGRSENEAEREETTSPGEHTEGGATSSPWSHIYIWMSEATPTCDEQEGQGNWG